ncbi:hypothetical protein FHT86_005645 [Rhizobium sp. BK313]|nr:hypothetical protein [Rhizobium sp. BK313]
MLSVTVSVLDNPRRKITGRCLILCAGGQHQARHGDRRHRRLNGFALGERVIDDLTQREFLS